jgi:hypothetical protein
VFYGTEPVKMFQLKKAKRLESRHPESQYSKY